MADKSNALSKKTIIAIVAIIVLLFVAGLSVGIFLADKGSTEAVDGNQTVAEENQTTDGNQATDGNQNADENQTDENQIADGSQTDGNNQEENNNNQTTTPDNNGTVVDNNGTTANNGVVNNNAENNEGTANNNATNNNTVANNNGVTTNTDVNEVGETTVTRVEEQERLVSRDYWDWWTPTSVVAASASAVADNIVPKTPDFTVEKTASTGVMNADGEIVEGTETLVYAGQNITYTIKVTNNGSEDIENIEITDKIPQNTTFVSFDNVYNIVKGTEIKGKNDETVGVKWVVSVPGHEENEEAKSVIVKFTVKVNEMMQVVDETGEVLEVPTTGTIANTAIANGKESNEGEPTKTAIITNNKSSVITRNGEVVETAKVGDRIKYTITVTNTGDAEGSTYISDNIPAGTKLISVDGKEIASEEKLTSVNWTVQLGAKGTETATVSKEFVVEIESINGEIKNIGDVGGTLTNTDEVETIDWSLNKESRLEEINGNIEDGKAEKGDKIYYTVSVTNNGSVDLNDFVVTDEMLGFKIDEENDTSIVIDIPAGETVPVIVNQEYTVTQDDIDAQKTIYNKAIGKYDGEDKEKEDEGTPVVDKSLGLEVIKKVSTDGVNYVVSKEGSENIVKVGAGENLYYQIYVENTSNVSLVVTAEDILSKDETANAIPETLLDEEGNVFTSATLEPTETIMLYETISIDQTIVNTVNKITNTVEIVGTTTEAKQEDRTEVNENDDATVEVRKPNITVEKTSIVKGEETKTTYVKEGQTIVYQITVGNNGETSGDAVVTDIIPDEVTLVAETVRVTDGDGNTTNYATAVASKNDEDKDVITITVTGLPVGEEVVVEFEATVNTMTDAQAEAGVEITNNVYLDGSETPADSTTDTATRAVIDATKTSECASAEKVSETESKTTYNVRPGDEITYTMTVTNSGLVESEKLTVEDRLPEGVTIKQNEDGTYVTTSSIEGKTATVETDEEGITVVTWSNVVVGAGETETFTITVTVDDLEADTYILDLEQNKVTVKQGDTTIEKEDPNDYNVVKPNITVEKTSIVKGEETKPTYVKEGQTIVYQITVGNNGETSGDAVVTDIIPDEVTLVAETVSVTDGDGNTTNYATAVASKNNEDKDVITITVTGLPVGEEVVVEFEATVNTMTDAQAEAGVTIINNVYLDESETPADSTTDTASRAVISATKSVSVNEADVVDTISNNGKDVKVVEEGSILTYEISVANDGLVGKDVLIVDGIPTGTTFVDGSIYIDDTQHTEYDEEDLEEGIEVTVPAQGEVTLSFKVEITGNNTTNIASENTTVDGEQVSVVTVNALISNYAAGQNYGNQNGNQNGNQGDSSSSTTVNHIDIGIEATADVYDSYGNLHEDVTVTLTSTQIKNAVFTAVQEGKEVIFTKTGTSTSTDNAGNSQVRIEGKFPVGTVSSPVIYTVTVEATVTVTNKTTGKVETIPVTLTGSMSYWDYDSNVCPGLQGRDEWTTVIGGSGIDMVLGGGNSPTGTLTIQKIVSGYTLAENKTFTFTVTDKDGNTETYTVTVKAGESTATVTITGLSFGEYTVTETISSASVDGYTVTPSYKVNGNEGNKITLAAGDNYNGTVLVTNTYEQNTTYAPIYNTAYVYDEDGNLLAETNEVVIYVETTDASAYGIDVNEEENKSIDDSEQEVSTYGIEKQEEISTLENEIQYNSVVKDENLSTTVQEDVVKEDEGQGNVEEEAELPVENEKKEESIVDEVESSNTIEEDKNLSNTDSEKTIIEESIDLSVDKTEDLI